MSDCIKGIFNIVLRAYSINAFKANFNYLQGYMFIF